MSLVLDHAPPIHLLVLIKNYVKRLFIQLKIIGIIFILVLLFLSITASSATAYEYVERWTQVNVTSIMNYKTNTPDNFIQQLGIYLKHKTHVISRY